MTKTTQATSHNESIMVSYRDGRYYISTFDGLGDNNGLYNVSPASLVATVTRLLRNVSPFSSKNLSEYITDDDLFGSAQRDGHNTDALIAAAIIRVRRLLQPSI